MEWNLSDLYESITDPRIEKDKQLLTKLIGAFVKTYKGRINHNALTAKTLICALEDLEKIEICSSRLEYYSYLLRVKNTQDSTISSFSQSISDFVTALSADLIWLDLEWKALPQKKAHELMSDPLLSKHLHHLSVSRLFTPFTLSEKEEMLLTKKSQTGILAFKRLYNELISREEFALTFNGKKEIHTVTTITPILTSHKDRSVRLRAAKVYSQVLSKNAKTYAFILNTKYLDKKTTDEIRKYKDMTQSTLLGYEVTPEVLDALSRAVQERTDISERYYKTKAKLLNHQLTEVDRYSEIYPAKNRTYTFSEAQSLILDAFREFSPQFGTIAELFFNKNWIDSEPTPGKTPGAFCAYITPDKHPYILMNYTNRVEDVSTLAHELGHGIHAYMARNNNLFEFHPSTATAEIASVFAENIIFEKLYAKASTKAEKINLLGNRIQGIFATVFRQIAFFEFEKEANAWRRDKGELSVEDIGNLYQQHLQKMFGKGLTLTPQHTSWWVSIKHFFAYDFYVFTYAFGELLTHALYQKYKHEGKSFVTKYEKMLAMGGSCPPAALLQSIGVNISDPDFWNEGLKLIDALVTEFEELTKS